MKLLSTFVIVFTLSTLQLQAQDSTEAIILKADPIRWLYKLSIGAEFYKNKISIGTNLSRYKFTTSNESLVSPLVHKCDIYIRKYSYSKNPYGFYIEGKLSILHHQTYLEEEYYDTFNHYDNNILIESSTSLRSSQKNAKSPITLGAGMGLGWHMTGDRISWDLGLGLQVIPLKASKKVTYHESYDYDLNGNLISQNSYYDEDKYSDQIAFSYIFGPTAIYNIHFMVGYNLVKRPIE